MVEAGLDVPLVSSATSATGGIDNGRVDTRACGVAGRLRGCTDPLFDNREGAFEGETDRLTSFGMTRASDLGFGMVFFEDRRVISLRIGRLDSSNRRPLRTDVYQQQQRRQ